MLSIKLDNNIENILLEKLNSINKIQDYIQNLIIEDLEDKVFENILKNSNKKNLFQKKIFLSYFPKKSGKNYPTSHSVR